MTPDFAKWVLNLDRPRRGRVLAIRKAYQTCVNWVSWLGEEAGIIVEANGRTATANDLRRSFGSRWAARVMPADLQQLMRHEAIETTMTYYVDVNTSELAQRLEKFADTLGDQKGDQIAKTD